MFSVTVTFVSLTTSDLQNDNMDYWSLEYEQKMLVIADFLSHNAKLASKVSAVTFPHFISF